MMVLPSVMVPSSMAASGEVLIGVEVLAGGFGGEGGEEVVVDFVAVAGGGERRHRQRHQRHQPKE